MQTNQIKSPTIYHVAKLCVSPKRQPQIPGTQALKGLTHTI